MVFLLLVGHQLGLLGILHDLLWSLKLHCLSLIHGLETFLRLRLLDLAEKICLGGLLLTKESCLDLWLLPCLHAEEGLYGLQRGTRGLRGERVRLRCLLCGLRIASKRKCWLRLAKLGSTRLGGHSHHLGRLSKEVELC